MKSRLTAILTFAALIIGSTHASATLQSAEGMTFAEAVSSMLSRFGPAEERRLPPDPNEPGVSKDLATINASMALFGTEAFPVKFPETFTTVCAPLMQLTNAYSLAGQPSGTQAMTQAQEIGLRDKNGLLYQDQAIPIFTAEVKCFAVHMAGFHDHWSNLPASERTANRVRGLNMMRSGAEMMVMGLVGSSVQTGLRTGNRKLAIDAAAAHTAALVSILPVSKRTTMRQRILADFGPVKRAWPSQYAKVIAALSGTRCEALCKVP